jgi:hypothetical protein
MALCSWCLPFLLRVPASPVPRSQRYYEGATTSHLRIHGHLLVRFHCPRDSSCLVFRCCAPGRLEASSGPGPWFLPAAPISGLLARGRQWDLSGLQAIHPVPLLRSRTPVEPTCPCHLTVTSMLPPLSGRRRPRAMADFGANPQLRHLLPYASRFTLPLACKACFRLAGSPLPGGSRTLWIAAKGFSSFDDHPPFLLS